jgi:hypothetical protein
LFELETNEHVPLLFLIRKTVTKIQVLIQYYLHNLNDELKVANFDVAHRQKCYAFINKYLGNIMFLIHIIIIGQLVSRGQKKANA